MRSIILKFNLNNCIYFALAETNRYSGKHNELPHSEWTPPNLNTSWHLQHARWLMQERGATTETTEHTPHTATATAPDVSLS